MLANRWKTKTRAVLVTLVFSALLVYGYFQAQDLITGPVVEVKYPEDNQTVEGKTFVLQGVTRNVSRINLNGMPILINTEGEFREKLPLVGRRNIIEIEVWDRFDRSKKVYHTVISSSDPFDIPSQEKLEKIRSGEEDDPEELSDPNNG